MAACVLTSYLNPSTTAHHTCTPSRVRLRRLQPTKASSPPHPSPAAAPAVHLGWGAPGRGLLGHRQRQWTRRGDGLVARAGLPSTSTLIFAFVFPLSLIIGTIFASIRIADQLDEKFLEEIAMNKAIMEEREAEDESEYELGEDGDDEAAAPEEEQLVPAAAVEVSSAAPRSRNRPKRGT